jgi:hypothetical protein
LTGHGMLLSSVLLGATAAVACADLAGVRKGLLNANMAVSSCERTPDPAVQHTHVSSCE